MDTTVMAEAIAGFAQRLERADAAGWSSPTPCAEWDVRTLVNHVVGELLWIPPLLEGKTIAEVGDRYAGDVLGADPMGAWSAAADLAQRAATASGAQERTVHLSFGDFSGSDYLGQITSDVIIHSWDLARGVGADDRWDASLTDFADGFLRPQIAAWRSAGAFGPAVPVGTDASKQDRLLAETGRPPDWTAPG